MTVWVWTEILKGVLAPKFDKKPMAFTVQLPFHPHFSRVVILIPNQHTGRMAGIPEHHLNISNPTSQTGSQRLQA
jgi:hypothetical protein